MTNYKTNYKVTIFSDGEILIEETTQPVNDANVFETEWLALKYAHDRLICRVRSHRRHLNSLERKIKKHLRPVRGGPIATD